MFKVTIVKIESVAVEGREWKKVADTGNENENGPKYAYATFPSTRNNETKVLEQEVEELDLKSVIKAVNGL